MVLTFLPPGRILIFIYNTHQILHYFAFIPFGCYHLLVLKLVMVLPLMPPLLTSFHSVGVAGYATPN